MRSRAPRTRDSKTETLANNEHNSSACFELQVWNLDVDKRKHSTVKKARDKKLSIPERLGAQPRRFQVCCLQRSSPTSHPNRASHRQVGPGSHTDQPTSVHSAPQQPALHAITGRWTSHPGPRCSLAAHDRPCAQSRANHACNENELRLSSIRARVHRRSLLFFVLFPRIVSGRGLHRPSFHFPFHSSFRCLFWGLLSLARTTFRHRRGTSTKQRRGGQVNNRRPSFRRLDLDAAPRSNPPRTKAPPTTTHGR